jgi:hypothetical protein
MKTNNESGRKKDEEDKGDVKDSDNMINNRTLGTLIVADLAGVENSFDPKDCNTIMATIEKVETKMDSDTNFKKQIKNTTGNGTLFDLIGNTEGMKKEINRRKLDKMISITDNSLEIKEDNLKTNNLLTLNIHDGQDDYDGIRYIHTTKKYIWDGSYGVFSNIYGIQDTPNNNLKSFTNKMFSIYHNSEVTKKNQTIYLDGSGNISNTKTERPVTKCTVTIDTVAKHKKYTITVTMKASVDYKELMEKYIKWFKNKNSTLFDVDRLVTDKKKGINRIRSKYNNSTPDNDEAFFSEINELLNNNKNNYDKTVNENAKVEEKKELFIKTLQYSISEIKNRANEGKFINSELELLRNEMLVCMSNKANGLLFTAPSIDTSCMSSYCDKDDDNNCFMMKTKALKFDTDNFSKIMMTIYQKLVTMRLSEKGIAKLFNELDVVIFTVFNISKKGEIEKIDNTSYYSEPTKYIHIDPLRKAFKQNNFENINNELMKIKTLFYTSKHGSIVDSPIKIKILNTITEMQEYEDNTTNHDKHNAIEKYHVHRTQDIIELIDKHNATTPIGTLAFTDTMAKFGNTNLCTSNEYDFNNEQLVWVVNRLQTKNIIEKVNKEKFNPSNADNYLSLLKKGGTKKRKYKIKKNRNRKTKQNRYKTN